MTTEITTTPEGATQGQLTLHAIERIVRDPDADVEKLERMLDLQERILTKEAQHLAALALQKFKSACPQLQKKSIIHDRSGRPVSRYTSFDSMMKQIRPLMVECGFTERFTSVLGTNGGITGVICTITHEAGHSWEALAPVCIDDSGFKNKVQGLGSAMSYGKRYALQNALGIETTEEDDDGHSTEDPPVDPGRPAWKKEEPAAPQTQGPEPTYEELMEVNMASNGITEAQLNGAIYVLTKKKFNDWRKLPVAWRDDMTRDEKWNTIMETINNQEI
jgi:hypothetical protein